MKDGFWLNYRTGEYYLIDEHEMWLRTPGNAQKLGVSQKLIDKFSDFTPVRDRNKFLIWVMQNSPVMRIRGHGGYVTFEYSSRSQSAPLDTILMWGKNNLGPLSEMHIVNFAGSEMTNIRWCEFKRDVDGGRCDSLLNAVTTMK